MSLDHSFLSGYSTGIALAAGKVKDAFEALPPTSDSATRDLLLDLYNEIIGENNVTQEAEVPRL